MAETLLKDAELIAVSLPCLYEFVRVLRRVYGFDQEDVANALQALLDAGNVAVDRRPWPRDWGSSRQAATSPTA